MLEANLIAVLFQTKRKGKVMARGGRRSCARNAKSRRMYAWAMSCRVTNSIYFALLHLLCVALAPERRNTKRQNEVLPPHGPLALLIQEVCAA